MKVTHITEQEKAVNRALRVELSAEIGELSSLAKEFVARYKCDPFAPKITDRLFKDLRNVEEADCSDLMRIALLVIRSVRELPEKERQRITTMW